MQPQETAPVERSCQPNRPARNTPTLSAVQAYLWGFPLRFYGGMVPEALKAGGSYVNDFRKFTDLKSQGPVRRHAE